MTTTTDPADKELTISESLKANAFGSRFYEHYIHGELKTPSFPDVALKMRKAIQQDCEIADLVKIINMDPVISGKLIQVVNSPFYMPMVPITNTLNAINRLGRKTTRDLVITFSLKNLIRSEKAIIKKLIQQSWYQSIKVSSMAYTLAKLTKKADSDEALLAGLLHNIGVLPILTFADSLSEDTYQPNDISLCINEVQGQIGSIILEQWEFPENLRKIPLQSSDWFANTGENLNLNDIVLLAKYHCFLGTPGADLPTIASMPAYQKLGDQTLTPEMSLQILHDAKQQVADTINFFSQ
ncbi:putative signal transduction protein [Methyloglobulus morosus KoM1]|uniref:Putative signal transduction protein n=1 Tax=Methyloglobulus morosus KoM1 TaxID=1116472 RepID=V5C4G8_9GAMM|nr:HDOD domain-containing protein [Methyloglobulus morosus]ESS73377.1 putative signal transduction protein [Methyloglobulus morosus KoM1]